MDVAPAVDFVSLAYQGVFDVGIVASHDTDLIPALDAVAGLRPARVESAAWRGRDRLYMSAMPCWCHVLEEPDFRAVRDDRNYLLP